MSRGSEASKTPLEALLGLAGVKHFLRVRQLPQRWDSHIAEGPPGTESEKSHNEFLAAQE